MRPAPAVRNVGAVIFWKCFHNVNNLWDAPGKKGLELGKLGQSLVGLELQTLPNIPLDRIMGFHSTDIGYAQIYLFLSI